MAAARNAPTSKPTKRKRPEQSSKTTETEPSLGGAIPGGELMWVRGYDGTAWSAWDPFFLVTNGL